MSKRPEVAGSNFMPKNWRNRPFCIFFCPNHIRQIFVVQKPSFRVFGILEVFFKLKRVFGLETQPYQPAKENFGRLKLKCVFFQVLV